MLHKVTATLHNYLIDFPCTYLVGAKRQDCKENYLKIRNHSRQPANTHRFLTDTYVVFELLIFSIDFCQQLQAVTLCVDGGRKTMGFLSADYGVIPNRQGRKFPAWEHLAPMPGSGRGDGWSDGWRQHNLHIVWFICLGMGSAEAPHVWDLGPFSSSVWYSEPFI